MPLSNDVKRFEAILANNGCNRYSAVQQVTATARQKLQEHQYKIRASAAITWVMQDVEPEIRHPNRVGTTTTRYENNYIKDILSLVDDSEITDAVIASFLQSKESHNLEYKYEQVNDEPRRSRVRILLRMIWFYLTDIEQ